MKIREYELNPHMALPYAARILGITPDGKLLVMESNEKVFEHRKLFIVRDTEVLETDEVRYVGTAKDHKGQNLFVFEDLRQLQAASAESILSETRAVA